MFCLLLLLASAAPQEKAPAQPEITGRVMEPGTNQGVSEAEILIFKAPGNGTLITGQTFTRDQALGAVVTDASGSFRYTPDGFGSFRVQAAKEGYTAAGNPFQGGPTNIATVTLDADHPNRDLHFALARPGELTGRVIDEETRKPVVNLRVAAGQFFYLNGRVVALPGGAAVTDEEGRFTIKNLRAGSYVVRIPPAVIGKEKLLTQFTADDLKAVDLGYPSSVWPGGRGEDSAIPVTVGSGAVANAGQLWPRKVRQYRVHARFAEGSCGPAEKAQVAISGDLINQDTLGEVPCGKDFLLRNLPPGPYRAEFWVMGRTRANRARGSATFEITDKNLDLTIPLTRGVDVDGRVQLAEGAAKAPVEQIVIGLIAVDGVNIADEAAPVKPAADGKFQLPNVEARVRRLMLSGVPAGYYVQEVRYNGAVVTGNIVALNGGSPAQNLDIVLDDKPATLTGKVEHGDHPVSRPYVVLVKWPAYSENVFASVVSTTGDEDGKFQFTGLAPGEYRLVAVSGGREKLDPPHLLEGLLAGAMKLTLGPRGFQNVTVAER